MKTCTLLLASDRTQSVLAEEFARAALDVVQVQSHDRSATHLEPLVPADVLLNFLSSPKVRDLAQFPLAINFHPAPPRYPGVGSASLALFDNERTHGATAHLMTERFDAGPILRVRRFPITVTGYRALFDRALDETLVLFFEVVGFIAADRPMSSQETWARPAWTRKEFEAHPASRRIMQ